MNMTVAYIVVFAASAVLALILTPLVIRLARALRLYDPRDARKVHTAPTPRIGGVAIVASVMAVSITAMSLPGLRGGVFAGIRLEMIVLLATSGFIFLVGVLDDTRNLPAKVKLIAQLLAAGAVCGFGIRISDIVLFDIDFGWLSWPITLLWVVGITNAVNLIDGLDGLSAGISAAACGVIAAFAIATGQAAMGLLMLALLGSLVGFLVFNFNPAKIFMGDSGSMFLGFFLATASLVSATKVATIMGLALPALALGLPIFDMILAVLRRILDRRSVFSADRGHVHHRLMDMGLKQHHAVILMYLVTLLAAGLGLLMMAMRGQGEVIIFVVALLALLTLFRLAGVLRFRKIWEQMSANLARNREIRRDRKHFETLQDRFRRAWTFPQWWRAVRRMARRMGFTQVRIQFRPTAEAQIESLNYQRNIDPPDADERMLLSIPVRHEGPQGLLRVEIEVPVDQPLETIGRRVGLFGRLLDEHPVQDLSDWQRLQSPPVTQEG